MDRLEQLRSLLAKNPTDELLWYTVGRESAKAGNFPDAVVAFEKAATLKPDYSTAFREWGQALTRMGQFAAARDVFAQGQIVAERTGDLQVKREIEILHARLPPST